MLSKAQHPNSLVGNFCSLGSERSEGMVRPGKTPVRGQEVFWDLSAERTQCAVPPGDFNLGEEGENEYLPKYL